MRLTIEEHREAIKRYGHIKPAGGWRTTLCSTRCTGTDHTCTREGGHRGPHVAHGLFKRVVAVWDSGNGAQSSVGAVRPAEKARERRGLGKGRPVGLRTGRPRGIVEALWDRVRTFSSVEDIALLVLLIALLWFAVDWLFLLMG